MDKKTDIPDRFYEAFDKAGIASYNHETGIFGVIRYAWSVYEPVEIERDRYKAALEQISETQVQVYPTECREIARKALESSVDPG